MWRVPNSARMLLPAEAQPQLRPTPLEEEKRGEVERWRRQREQTRGKRRKLIMEGEGLM